eukprot:CAMPEP_0173393238 /NCGR_PEP_ID=MMETSP1356-20130122/21997_1 /TAXON_ID=77927 ORGANISM="Hemiselmis virescens, Strain PCC157" /NCGR_SAMPLE_ID=MMETSP1356 /ASSEMBLY_ACC=CAM_ASM_000847 /LENGTH=102 /DNA_ID=CAMNT_0014351231 /DNA_START=33 /DNA_END=341 /DNA_ORIENTATION=-
MKSWRDKKPRRPHMSKREKREFMSEMQSTFIMLFFVMVIVALLVSTFVTVNWREYPLFDDTGKLKSFSNWTSEVSQASRLKVRPSMHSSPMPSVASSPMPSK